MSITIIKVVSQNFIMDYVAKFQNLVGANLSPYEKMINKGIIQVQQELTKKNVKLKWFRYETAQLANGAISILFYGEEE